MLYSKPCKRQIREKITLHYPEGECETVWEQVQRQYVTFLRDWRTDLGGSKNFHNGKGGTYDCIALMSYYVVCREKTSLAEIEEMEGALFLPSFRRLRFVDCNKPFWRRLLHRAFVSSKKSCDKWGDYEMHVAPYDPDGPIYYEFTACPTAEFARQFGLLEVMPALCAPTTPPWSCSARGSCAARHAQTAAAATIRSAATGTHGVRSTPNTATRRGIGAIRPDGGSVVGLACPANGGGTFPACEKYPKARQNQGFGILFGRQVGFQSDVA